MAKSYKVLKVFPAYAQIDVYEYFIWDPYVVSLDVENEDFSDFFEMPQYLKELCYSVRIAKFRAKRREWQRRIITELYKSIRIIRFGLPTRRRPIVGIDIDKELLRSLEIVNWTPFVAKRTGETPITKVAVKRLLAVLSLHGFALQEFHSVPVSTWTERHRFLRKKAIREYRMVTDTDRALRRLNTMIASLEKQQAKLEARLAEERYYKQFLWGKAEHNLFNSVRICDFDKTVETRLWRRSARRKPISRRKSIQECYVTLSEKGREVLGLQSTSLATLPWKVLTIHDETIVVERVSKTGTKHPNTIHKSFLKFVPATTEIDLPIPDLNKILPYEALSKDAVFEMKLKSGTRVCILSDGDSRALLFDQSVELVTLHGEECSLVALALTDRSKTSTSKIMSATTIIHAEAEVKISVGTEGYYHTLLFDKSVRLIELQSDECSKVALALSIKNPQWLAREMPYIEVNA